MPVPIIMGAIAVGGLVVKGVGALLGYRAQNEAKKRQQEANARTQALTTDAANKDAELANATLDERLRQIRAQRDQFIADNTEAAERATLTNNYNAVSDMATVKTNARRSILSADRASRMADGEARVFAGAAGVQGASVDALLNDIGRSTDTANAYTSRDAASEVAGIDTQRRFGVEGISRTLAASIRNTNTNVANEENQVTLQRLQIDATRNNRINGVTNLPTPAGANGAATALQIGGDILGFLGDIYTMSKK